MRGNARNPNVWRDEVFISYAHADRRPRSCGRFAAVSGSSKIWLCQTPKAITDQSSFVIERFLLIPAVRLWGIPAS